MSCHFYYIVIITVIMMTVIVCIHAVSVTDFFSFSEISLNVRDPPTEISIIPEEMVKPEWGLPEVKYRFITR